MQFIMTYNIISDMLIDLVLCSKNETSYWLLVSLTSYATTSTRERPCPL